MVGVAINPVVGLTGPTIVFWAPAKALLRKSPTALSVGSMALRVPVKAISEFSIWIRFGPSRGGC